jgi:hypothetical protein
LAYGNNLGNEVSHLLKLACSNSSKSLLFDFFEHGKVLWLLAMLAGAASIKVAVSAKRDILLWLNQP